MKITDKSAKAEPQKPAALIELPSVAHMPEGWQHYCVKVEAGAPLDAFGVDGWELVAVVPCLTDPAMVVCYFKRRPR